MRLQQYTSNSNPDADGLYWWHSIALPNGRVTPGEKNLTLMTIESGRAMDHIDLKGKSLIDIGAWNGGFSVEAFRRGAARVVALDHYVWNEPSFRGRESIELVKRETGLPLELVDIDLDQPNLNLRHLGKFDVALFLGVFYHLVDPIAALREICAITDDHLVIETHTDLNEISRPAMVFYPGAECGNDTTNWWGPNHALIRSLLSLNGFDVTNEIKDRTRAVFHARRKNNV